MYKLSEDELLLFSADFVRQKEYWSKKLSGNVERTEILAGGDKDQIGSKNIDRLDISIPHHLSAGIINLGSQSNLSIFIILLAGLKALIYRYTNKTDITVLSPVNKLRISEETINNCLMIRDQVNGEMTFKDLLLRIRTSTLEAYDNQDYPFDRLMEYLFPEARDPHFVSVIACSLGNIHESRDMEMMGSKLHFSFLRQLEQITGNILFDADVYGQADIERMLKHLLAILAESVANVNIKIAGISFLAAAEKNQLISVLNDTEVKDHYSKVVIELFEEQAAKQTDHTAVVYRDERLTFGQLNDSADQWARVLAQKGIKTNSLAGLMVEPCKEMVVGIVAILKAGGAYLPMEPEAPDYRITYMLNDSHAGVLLTRKHLIGGVQFGGETIDIEDKELYEGEGGNLNNTYLAADLLYLIYTSGTTGKPKGVLISNENLVNYINWTVREIDIKAEDRAILTSSFAFDALYTQLFASILHGCELHVISRETFLIPELLINYLEEKSITYIKVTPSLFNVMVQSPDFSAQMFQKLRFIMLGGEPINVKDVELAHTTCPHVRMMNHYGPTETTIGSLATFIDFDKFAEFQRTSTIGKPIDNTRVYILDENLQLLPAGLVGELYIGGKGVGVGYLNNPQLTGEKFLADPFHEGGRLYRTGDLARWLPDGSIKLSGRIDDQIKIRGNRVELGEIESRLLKHDAVREVVVIDREDRNGDRYICAYIVAEKDVSPCQLREYLTIELPPYMIPAYFVQLERIPLTEHNKVNRKALPVPDISEGGQTAGPRDALEKKLVGIWAGLLGLKGERVGIDSNFFELGGHSLKTINLASLIHRELNVKVPLAQIFKNPTIRGLGQYIKEAERERYCPIEPVDKREYYVLSSAQKRMYVLQQMEPTSTAYNISWLIPLDETFEVTRLEETFKGLIKRHESLRTSILLIDDRPVQRVHEHIDFQVHYYDLVSCGSPEDIWGQFVKPFDLNQAPFFRVGLINGSGNRRILMVDMHHIISDGVTMDLVSRDFWTLYEGKELHPLPLQYKDYAEWQNSEEQRRAVKKQEEFWLNEFRDKLPKLDLPTDYPRPDVQSFEGDSLRFELAEAETKSLFEIARAANATMFMNLLATFNIFLAKLCDQEDIIIGTPIAGRRHADLENIIGLFVNTLPLRNYPSGDKTYDEFLREVRERFLRVLENQDCQLETLVEILPVSREAGRHPLFDVFFSLKKFAMTSEEITAARLEQYNFEYKIAKVDFAFYAIEAVNGIICTFEYSTRLFEKGTIALMRDHYLALVRSIIHDAHTKIRDLDQRTELEKKLDRGAEVEFKY
jgi:amino acid adenylation domain-containing protein